LHWLWLALAAPFMLFPSPKRSLAMLVVPGLWLLHWLVVGRLRREAGGRLLPVTCNLKPVIRNLQFPIASSPIRSSLFRKKVTQIHPLLEVDRKADHDLSDILPAKYPRSARRVKGEGQAEGKVEPSPLATRHSTLSITPFNVALLLMALMVLVSEWATFDLSYSLPKISGMVLGLGVFFAVAREGERLRGWWLSLLAFLGVGLGISALGLVGTRWATDKINSLNPIIARLPLLITGLQGAESGFHPNEVAGALSWVLPVMLAVSVGLSLLPRSSQRARRGNRRESDEGTGTRRKLNGWRLALVTILCVLATFSVGAVFVLTQSRGGYIGLALTLPLLILVALPRRWRWISLIALVFLAILLGFVISSHWEVVRAWVAGSDLTADPALSLNTLDARLEIWSRAIYGIQDFPFTGMGMNAFRKVVPVLYPLFLVSPDKDIGHAHNEFLQAALDLGIPGLIAFIAIYIIAFWMLVDIWRNVPTFNASPPGRTPGRCEHSRRVQRAMVLGLGGGLLAHMLYGLTDAVALGAKPGLLFWMLLGLIAGLYGQMRARDNLAA
jgi:putative inorganic carbon (HCO3(-)) transporter